MPENFDLSTHRISARSVFRNLPVPELYEAALRFEPGTQISSSGALVALSGEKTGRSPTDKRLVIEPETTDDVWWGTTNIGIDEHTFEINRERACDYLGICDRVYVVDGYAGWNRAHRIKVRVVCARAYHALFMSNMLINPTEEQLESFGAPDLLILNAGAFPANRHTTGMSSKTTVDLSLAQGELVILGTEYAGEMKKGLFTMMNHRMPAKGILSMHCSATESVTGGDASLLFGLSGTGKTTLSADPNRRLVGDDEHCWTDDGIFNIEGGCYAKAVNLTREAEPQIFDALRFGAVLENVVLNEQRQADYSNTSITQNTRGSYPIEYIDGSERERTCGHPKNVIFLTCDAFGVLPPVSRLTEEQAMYHYISGYTAKVAGTEMGVTQPEATFSPAFGGPFLVWHPAKYAELMASRLREHGVQAWLVNTGWTGGGVGTGSRIALRDTRAIIDAIHAGEVGATCAQDPIFGLSIPAQCAGLSPSLLHPRQTWSSCAAYDDAAQQLAKLFQQNFLQYAARVQDDVRLAGPAV